ncbi:DUF2274 domain-containing protein [Algimonas porphyrae]|uniref:DUF2274 domain-containing protein n=1 Tax=Algimonas porphyrae TaxID=1128113 RepID=A0ABQ5V1A0_9PROT|nr:DUF2274 domain-containing protein [Algimonas porphyrae]GLQ21311.1 hypothetical protein GCM10007854_22660 [Algimonas porphyrae]
MNALKIGKLPDTTPVKLSLSIPPNLQADLEDYAAVYADAYGEKAKVTDLIPSMLAGFMASDSNFKKARKALAESQ